MVNKHLRGNSGFSLYCSTPLETNKQLIERFANNGFTFVFTSLNIESTQYTDDALKSLFLSCRQKHLMVIVDINQESLRKYGEDALYDLGVQAVRIDDGISEEMMVALSKKFIIVLNAATIEEQALNRLLEKIPVENVIACYNYYPKEYTGLSALDVKEKNQLFKQYNLATIAFIAGEVKRMPIFQGLPTIEAHRHKKPLEAALSCLVALNCDAYCIGDIDVLDKSLLALSYVSKKIIPLQADVPEALKEIVFHNRIDASAYVIRAANSRTQLKDVMILGQENRRPIGAISLSNEQYGRYCHELEIALVDLPADYRQTVVGYVHKHALPLLQYVKHPYAFQLF